MPSVSSGRAYGISCLAIRLRRRTSTRIRIEPVGDGVEQPLAHEGALEPAGRAVGSARRLVGQPDMRIGAIGWNAIGTRQHRRGEIGDGRRVGAHVGALIVKYFVLDRENAPVTIDGGADVMLLLARMIGGDQMLAAILDPLDRPPHAQRRGAYQNVLRIELAANAETAADMTLIEVNRRCGASKHAGDLVPIPMRHLGGAVKLEHVARRIVSGDRAAGFQRDAGMAPDRQRRGDHGVRGAKSGVDVAIALADDSRLGRSARLEFARLFVRHAELPAIPQCPA